MKKTKTNYVTQQQLRGIRNKAGSTPGGSVRSVALSMPRGFSVSGSPVTSQGTLNVSLSAGYGIVKFVTERPSPGTMEEGVLYAVIQ